MVAVRNRREGELGAMSIEEVAEKMKKEVENKTI
jgi:threonyl-tRNA synthetase